MKISVNIREIDGPWGGGNNFYKSLKFYGHKHGHKIINHLFDNDIDLILILCNLKSSSSASYTVKTGIEYSKTKNIPIIQRVNECDLRKNTSNVDNEIIRISEKVNGCIFVSDWLKNDVFKEIKNQNKISIRNGANTEIFKKFKRKKNKTIKIITHHFSNNLMKGYKYYSELDKIIGKTDLNQKVEFTLIGNVPKELTFQNSQIVPLLPIEKIANELNNYDLYITASEYEPGANHVVEALSSGLPIIYLNSGSMKEYVGEFGLEFEKNNIEKKIREAISSLDYLSTKVYEKYDYSAAVMCNQYFNFFEKIIQKFNAK